MKFFLITTNSTFTALLYLSFIAFVVFGIFNCHLYKHAFYVMIISVIITFFTPNKSEIGDYWIKTENKE